jgi:polyribonucleotide nucleotidyltransferase
MFDHQKQQIEWGGRTLTLETGKMARQADGAVLATYGETAVLATVVSEREPKAGFDFFPLTVNYQEKYFASGRIPGGFFKREGRPTEKETLTSRLIDRPIRPLFAAGYKNDTQVVLTVLSHDLENDPDIVALVAASAALTLPGAPFMGPFGGVRVVYITGVYVLTPLVDQV